MPQKFINANDTLFKDFMVFKMQRGAMRICI